MVTARMVHVLPLVMVLAMLASRAAAADVAVVEAITSGTEFNLKDGTTVRLAGVRVSSGLQAKAQAALEDLALGREVRLVDASTDRWGRQSAQVERADGVWLQGALLAHGLALVQPDSGARLARMREIERTARESGQGVWSGAGPIADAHHPDRLEPGFAIVRGEVQELARTRYAVYLNFGEPWWQDFTLKIGTGAPEQRFEQAGQSLERLIGRTIEARGFVVEAGGPLIELRHPDQIEVLP